MYFSYNYHNHTMFQDVPECSGMFPGKFHVPGFIDGSLLWHFEKRKPLDLKRK